jgi:hypothetical protein
MADHPGLSAKDGQAVRHVHLDAQRAHPVELSSYSGPVCSFTMLTLCSVARGQARRSLY